MRLLLAFVFALLMPMAALAADAEQKVEGLATDSAKAWLGLVDAGKYSESWAQAGTEFRANQTAKAWAATIRPVRVPLGAAVWRHPSGVVMQTSGLGAPDGALVFFTTDFAHKKQVLEKLTMKLEGSAWKVTSYTFK
jgi:hypothetical protein